ncbi:glutamate ABC transporter substrate-binding protein [Nocardia sp. CDC159]|uniref:Glutamate ABC transporter substrate-binding protein n=1 Tax=Nocardia pulmonis TaxID=2951408 RepID=A0A9X2EAJ7_9NOCA|nr:MULTISPECIES: glutamate ABC transporter substrate-binding protein [Nocardia]MCM6777357.1 glutamate ABC transporter substrate-binding protein [Nocardia pulmonis]MCM6790242.1 glutamate ABC transporter substrate-binding protein [Nocardia sp. CDC159]
MSARHALAVVLTATALLAGACGGEPPAPRANRPASYTEPPLPAKAAPARTDSPLPPETDPQCPDATASLRPAGITQGPAIDAIRARGRLLVGLDPGSNLFSFRDPISGTLAGFDVDIAKEIAADLFGDRERVEYRMLSSAERERALQDRTVDVVVKTMTITCDRRQRVEFSSPYFLSHQRVLAVRNSGITGLADLAGKRVCVAAGTTSLNLIRRKQPGAAILTVPAWADCLVVLQQRQVDAISTDDALLAGLAIQDPNYTEIVGDNLSDEPYGVGIPKGNDDMVRFVNATLERIRSDGTWNRIYQRWLLAVLGPSAGPPQPSYRD